MNWLIADNGRSSMFGLDLALGCESKRSSYILARADRSTPGSDAVRRHMAFQTAQLSYSLSLFSIEGDIKQLVGSLVWGVYPIPF